MLMASEEVRILLPSCCSVSYVVTYRQQPGSATHFLSRECGEDRSVHNYTIVWSRLLIGDVLLLQLAS